MDAIPAPAAAPPRPAALGAERCLFSRSPVRESARPIVRDPLRAPETLHPSLWRGHQLGRIGSDAVATGFARLDAELPGGGWPRRALAELLLPHPGIGEIRLLAPALVAAQRAGRLVMFFDPPAALAAAALAGLGFEVEDLLIIQARAHVVPGSDSLWALEQALKSGHVGAVVAWLPPRLRADRLRRLQLAAHQHDGPAFVMREAAVAGRPTASPLRLGLQAGGADRLQVRVMKRRGPPLDAPLLLELPAVLSAAARRRSGSASERAAALHAATFVNFA
jgi:protein ImuA